MKKTKIILISLTLVLLFLTYTISPIAITDSQYIYSKISPELLSAFQNLDNSRSLSDKTLEVIVHIDNTATEKFQTIASEIAEPEISSNMLLSDNNISSIDAIHSSRYSKEEKLSRINDIQDYIRQRRTAAIEIYTEENTKSANLLAQTGANIKFISEFSPLLICDLTYDETIKLARNDTVLRLDYGETELVLDMSESLPAIGINEYEEFVDSYSAEGIVLGMIESAAPDTSYSCFNGIENKITAIGNMSQEKEHIAHASRVAAIMVGKDTGIAQNFEHLYCIRAGYVSDFYSNVETLLKEGVNVINMSAGYCTEIKHSDGTKTYYGLNEYDTLTQWVDHIAYNHSVHFIKSSGNKGINGVTKPGMAHNIITVGNVNTLSGYISSSSSRNVNNSNIAYKPDLCAPGTNIDIPNNNFSYYNDEQELIVPVNDGTSFATPHVSAIVAVLCSYEPLLLTKQALMKSILMSSVSINSPNNYDTQFTSTGSVTTGYKTYGTGIVNVNNALFLIDNEDYINGSITASENYDVFSIGNLSAGQTVTVTLTFLKRCRYRTESHLPSESTIETSDNADLDLYITPANTFLAGACTRTSSYTKSITTNNYSETIIYTAPASGEFLICVDKEHGQDPYEIIYAVSWLVHNNDLN
ncbi:MAG: S8/S53 family peptidase [Clostridia bacterium]|nr:S8/S53 family peptidase [Clostridia bacterium]